MSTKRAFMPWFENLNKAYQFVVILGALGGFALSGVCLTYVVLVFVIDSRVQPQLEPLQKMMEFVLRDSGRWDAFMEEEARRERARKAFEPAPLTAKEAADLMRRSN